MTFTTLNSSVLNSVSFNAKPIRFLSKYFSILETLKLSDDISPNKKSYNNMPAEETMILKKMETQKILSVAPVSDKQDQHGVNAERKKKRKTVYIKKRLQKTGTQT